MVKGSGQEMKARCTAQNNLVITVGVCRKLVGPYNNSLMKALRTANLTWETAKRTTNKTAESGGRQ
jgi:hypothetical protein